MENVNEKVLQCEDLFDDEEMNNNNDDDENDIGNNNNNLSRAENNYSSDNERNVEIESVKKSSGSGEGKSDKYDDGAGEFNLKNIDTREKFMSDDNNANNAILKNENVVSLCDKRNNTDDTASSKDCIGNNSHTSSAECQVSKKKKYQSDTYGKNVVNDYKPTLNYFFCNNTKVDMTNPKGGLKVTWNRILDTVKAIHQHRHNITIKRVSTTIEDFDMVMEDPNIHVRLPKFLFKLIGQFENNHRIYETRYVINHLSPLDCYNLSDKHFEDVSIRNIVYRTKNESTYLEIEYNNPIKVLFCATKMISDAGSKGPLILNDMWGNYLSDSLRFMYEKLYKMAQNKVEQILRDAEENERSEDEQQSSKSKRMKMDSTILDILKKKKSYKVDEKVMNFLTENVNDYTLCKVPSFELLATSGGNGKNTNSKLKMFVIQNGYPKLDDIWNIEFDGIFLSSHIRCRIVSEGAFLMQIYSRCGMQLID